MGLISITKKKTNPLFAATALSRVLYNYRYRIFIVRSRVLESYHQKGLNWLARLDLGVLQFKVQSMLDRGAIIASKEIYFYIVPRKMSLKWV